MPEFLPDNLPSPESMNREVARHNVWTTIAVVLLLVICNLVVFGRVVTFDLLSYDDKSLVTPFCERFGGLTADGIRFCFTSEGVGFRVPLVGLSFLVETEFFGINAAAFHRTSLLLHVASTLLLFFTLRGMTGRVWQPAMVAAVFAIHPLHVEPVAWVGARIELLCGFFWILGMYAYYRYCRAPGPFRYSLVVIAYCCALMSKPMALTFPFALLLLDYWPLRRLWPRSDLEEASDVSSTFSARSPGRLIVEKMPLFVIMAMALVITFQAKVAQISSSDIQKFSPGEKLTAAIQTYAIYVLQLFYPRNLNYFYMHPATQGGVGFWTLTGCASLLLFITITACYLVKRAPYLLVGWLWYLGVFVPAVGIVQVGWYARADRYTYLPQIGLLIMVCWGVPRLLRSWSSSRAWLAATSLAAVASLMAVSCHQIAAWKTDDSFYQHALQVDPHNYKVLMGIGGLSESRGKFALAETYYSEAFKQLPELGVAPFGIGRCCLRQNRAKEAIPLLQHALRAMEDSSRAPVARVVLAACYIKIGDVAGGEREFATAIKAIPNDPRPYINFADFWSELGNYERACSLYQKAHELAPKELAIALRYGDNLAKTGRAAHAVAIYEAAHRSHPRAPEAPSSLAWLLAANGDKKVRNPQRAVVLAEFATRQSDGESAVTFDTLGVAYAAVGRFQDAAQAGAKALELAAAGNDVKQREGIKKRLALYRAGQAYLDRSVGETGHVTKAP